jgi:ketosteroid isomerase-like protein
MNVIALDQQTRSAASDHQNAELVQNLYRSLRARDMEAAAELIYPDYETWASTAPTSTRTS